MTAAAAVTGGFVGDRGARRRAQHATRDGARRYDVRLRAPHPWQAYILEHGRRFNAITCGRRWGKTEGIGVNRVMDGAVRGWPVGWFAPSYKVLADAWRACDALLSPIIKPRGGRNAQERRLEFVTGGSLEFWTLDSPDAGRSRKYKRIVVDEAAMIKNFDHAWQGALLPTLADLSGDAWLLTTPRGFDEYYRLTRKFRDRADGFTINVSTYTNPYIELAELELLKSIMAPRYFAQEIMASFESLANRIVYQFDYFLNTIEPPAVPHHGPLLVGMDFNVNPMTAVVGFLREQRELNELEGRVEVWDELVLFDEIELHDSGTEEMCAELVARYPGRELVIYPDPTGNDRRANASRGVTNFTLIEQAGLRLVAGAVPTLVDKFNEINGLCCNARGQRRLKVSRQMKRTLECLEQYSYKLSAQGLNTSLPDKGKHDHLVDCVCNIVHCEFPIAGASGAVQEVLGR